MNSKDLVRCMVNFLNEHRDMDCNELRKNFAAVYGMSEDDAKKMIVHLTALMLFSEHFGVTI